MPHFPNISKKPKGKKVRWRTEEGRDGLLPADPLMGDERAKVILEETAPLFNQRKNSWYYDFV
jgi:hypothetical protein